MLLYKKLSASECCVLKRSGSCSFINHIASHGPSKLNLHPRPHSQASLIPKVATGCQCVDTSRAHAPHVDLQTGAHGLIAHLHACSRTPTLENRSRKYVMILTDDTGLNTLVRLSVTTIIKQPEPLPSFPPSFC